MTTTPAQSRAISAVVVSPAPRALGVTWPALGAVVLTGICTILFWDFLRRQYLWAVTEPADWGHTLVIPFIAAYFVYLNRRKIASQPFSTAWFGLAPILAGLALYAISTIGPPTLHHHNLQGAGVMATVGGLALLFFGWRAMRWLWFPLLYVFLFGQTISERLLTIVTFKLQDITAIGAHQVLALFMDVDRGGNTLYIHHNGQTKPLNIAEACSGMRMLMAFLALGTAMAFTGLKYVWQRAALVIMAVPTAVAVNVVRVISLGLLCLLDSDFAAGDFHSFVGLVWLVPAFFIYLGLMWVIKHMVIEETRGAGPGAVTP